MKFVRLSLRCLLAVAVLPWAMAQQPCNPTDGPLTNGAIVSLLKAGLAEDIIIAKIQQGPNSFDTSPAALANLKSAGLSDQVLLAMVHANPRVVSREPTAVPAVAITQRKSPPVRSTVAGTVQLYGDGGWSFGLPAVMTAVSVGPTSISSPEKKTLAAPHFGVSVTAWKFLTPFVDVGFYDTGKAFAGIGPVTSQASATTFSVNGGLRFVHHAPRIQEYVEFGGGVLHQTVKGTFTAPGISNTFTDHASTGEIMYGGGIQLFAWKHWGSDVGYDAFHVTQQTVAGGQNFGRVRIGVFYQTKATPK